MKENTIKAGVSGSIVDNGYAPQIGRTWTAWICPMRTPCIITLYPEWSDLVAKKYTTNKAGFKFSHSGDLYKTIPDVHTFAAQWVPGVGTESIYTRIDETHDGSKYDPIPYNGNMALTAGLYYTQDGVTYFCGRDTGNPVYNALSELVGLYVAVVETI